MIDLKLFEEQGIDLLGKEWGSVKTFCPKCHDTRTDQKDKSLSVSIDDGLWNCHYPPCSWKGSLNKVAYQYTYPIDREFKCSKKVEEYFFSRAIGKATLEAYKIGSEPNFSEGENILFPFYLKGKLINIKYRSAKKEFRLIANSKLIFYGMDIANTASSEEVFIVEGEMDALSFYEVGIRNVVSVPNGASNGGGKLEYLDHCFDFLKSKKRIVIAVDNDEVGQGLAKALVSRIGSEVPYN